MLKARQGVELITSGELRVVDDAGAEVPWDGATLGEITVRGNVAWTATQRPGGDQEGDGRRLVPQRRRAVVHPDGYGDQGPTAGRIISGGENISSVEVEGTCCGTRP